MKRTTIGRKEGKKEGRSKSNDEVKVWTGNNKRNGRKGRWKK